MSEAELRLFAQSIAIQPLIVLLLRDAMARSGMPEAKAAEFRAAIKGVVAEVQAMERLEPDLRGQVAAEVEKLAANLIASALKAATSHHPAQPKPSPSRDRH